MKKKKNKKNPALKMHSLTLQEVVKMSHHEDTALLFSGTIKNPMTEYTEGVNTYRIVPIIMQDKNADEVITNLQRKIAIDEKITKADFLPLVLCPLMGGQMSQSRNGTIEGENQNDKIR